MRRFFNICFRVVITVLVLLLLAVPFAVRRVDRTPYTQTGWYRQMMQRLDSLAATHPPPVTDTVLRVGYAKVSITPNHAVPTAGYGKREGRPVLQVHDSLFVRTLWLQQGNTKAAIVSADLLIIPPEVTQLVKAQVSAAGIEWNNVFIGSTHTHNSMGGWGKNYIGELFAGTYNQELVNNLAAQIIQSIALAARYATGAQLVYEERQAPQLVRNRVLGDSAQEYDVLHSLQAVLHSGETVSLHSFAAHATTLSDSVMQLSRDYPGALLAQLEQQQPFAMYMAGAVGSMGPVEPAGSDWQQLSYMANGLADTLQHGAFKKSVPLGDVLWPVTLPLELREPQWRFTQNWCFRHWLWSRLYGDYPAEVKALKIGDLLLVGMPCDFGGELMAPLQAYAQQKGKHLMVTSFNGGYCGYITPDNRYDAEGYETRVMNWFGPGNGAYFSEVIRRLVDIM
ncbi:MAG: neutral/alkaline non-lysosomal ceramidase N-terminal domain-containing protein [Chitinophagaceae bacterium]|nr:neutral/alkaline non-lysosomal ceramidase N-terminal domain-containing protein [Chitinophagaceae bacterium]